MAARGMHGGIRFGKIILPWMARRGRMFVLVKGVKCVWGFSSPLMLAAVSLGLKNYAGEPKDAAPMPAMVVVVLMKAKNKNAHVLRKVPTW